MKDKRKYADRAAYMIRAVTRRMKKLRVMAIKYKGGKCAICGYKRCSAALEFHHIKRGEKDFGLSSRGLTRSFDKIQKELDKCMMLCSNCHREVHAGKTQLSAVKRIEK